MESSALHKLGAHRRANYESYKGPVALPNKKALFMCTSDVRDDSHRCYAIRIFFHRPKQFVECWKFRAKEKTERFCCHWR